MKRTAMIHSLNATAEVEIIQKIGNNHVIAEYCGKHYTAVDNPFTGLIYVDDKFGEVDIKFRF